jgi:DNA repair protein Rad10
MISRKNHCRVRCISRTMSNPTYSIPDLDDDASPSASLNLFSKRARVESSSNCETTRPSDETDRRTDAEVLRDTPAPAAQPPPPVSSSSSSLLVHSRQRGNPLLKYLRQVKWEYSDTIQGGADYSMSRSSCALYLSLRYHSLNPNYIYDRLKTTRLPYQLKILLVQCDVTEPSTSLKELARLCVLYELTLLLSWNDEESARYLETYRILEGKSAENLLDAQQHQSTDFLSKFIDTMTQVSDGLARLVFTCPIVNR